MNALAKVFKAITAAVVALVIAWAFFDVGRRLVTHWAALAQRPVELTVLHWGDPTEDKIVDDLTQRFEAEHGNVRIVRINAGSDFVNKLKTMMAADSAPDLFYLKPDMLPELAEDKLILPLDDYVNAEPAAWRNDFWPILLKAFHYDPATGAIGQGHLYGMPKDFTTTGFYINCDLFEKVGVDWRKIQKEGWTWDEFSDISKKVRALNGTAGYEDREIYGTMFQIWPDTLRAVLWTYNGEFFKTKPDGNPDFAKLALGDAGAQNAMNLIRRMRIEDRTAINPSGIAKDGGQEFKNGNIGCMGPVGQWYVPQFKELTAFHWDIVPTPRGTTRASPIFYNGWTISAHSKHPKEAYALLRFLCGRDGQVQQGRAGLAIPALQSVANSDDFLNPPGFPPHDEHVFLDAIGYARLAPLPKPTEFGDVIANNTNLAIAAGRVTPEEAAKMAQADWSHELNKPLRTKTWPTMPWKPILGFGTVVLVGLTAFLVVRAKREKLGSIDRATERSGFTFIAPWVIGFTLLTLGPMIVSLLLAFSQWTGMVPLGGADAVGLANFKQLFTADPLFLQSLKVTAYFVALGVPLGQITALLIAMLMNSRVKGIAFFRTVYFVPSVISGAALAVLWLQLFNGDYGIINHVLTPVLKLVQLRPPNWFGYDQSTTPPVLDAARWAVPGFVIMGLWGVGSGMIIYLAGLKGISQSLYEAARIDGAGPVRQAWNVTIPMLSPLIFYNLVMGIIGSFQIFTQAYMMTDPAQNENATLFYVLSLYRQAFQYHNMGYASAMAWVLFLIVLTLTLIVFKGSRKLVYYEGLR